MRGKLTKLSGTERSGPVRTASIEGEFDSIPCSGESFIIHGKPIDPEACLRVWKTSRVTSCYLDDSGYSFSTETGSKYILEVMP